VRISKHCVVTTQLIAGLSWAQPALADDSAPDDAPARPLERWYGWQTLTADGIAATLIAPTLVTNANTDEALWCLGIGGYAFASPIIHLTHGRPGIAAGVFGLRLGVPVVGLILGAQLDKNAPLRCNAMLDCRQSHDGMVVGGLLGGVLVAVLDATVFAYESTKPVRYAYDMPQRLRLWPSVAFTQQGGSAIVSGSF
jgi:hypothetical protein